MSIMSYDPNLKADRQTETPLDTLRYTDADYEYLCEAVPETLATTAAWRVSRVAFNGSSERFARGGRFACAADSVETVQALFA